jgi:hypothetical protein
MMMVLDTSLSLQDHPDKVEKIVLILKAFHHPNLILQKATSSNVAHSTSNHPREVLHMLTDSLISREKTLTLARKIQELIVLRRGPNRDRWMIALTKIELRKNLIDTSANLSSSLYRL